MRSVAISKPDADELIRHAEDCMPNESCALLLGRGRTVSRVLPARNAAASAVSFEIPPDLLLDAYRTADLEGLEVMGIFHSHPCSRAYPSKKDQTFMELNPVPWLIYSGSAGDLRAYVLDPDVTEIRLAYLDPSKDP